MASNLDVYQILSMIDETDDNDSQIDSDESDIDEDLIIPQREPDPPSDEDEDVDFVDLDLGPDSANPGSKKTTDGPNPILWTDQLHQVQIEDFLGSPGVNPDIECLLDCGTTPFQYLNLFIPETFYEHIAEQTNLYASNNKHPKSWETVDKCAIKQYLYINFMFGIHHMNEYKHFWSEDELLNLKVISSVMSRGRYEQINRFFM